MPTQDNCEDLNVESCVDENGQTIQGGDSYSVPTGRYVKHVVNVCGSGGGADMKACADGGLEVIGSGDDACMQIKTEKDGALVLDGGILKIDSTKLKVTTDNVYPAGTDPGLLSTIPTFVGPEGEVWDNQSDYNIWLYEDQKRQDAEIEALKPCNIPEVTDVLGQYNSSPIYWTFGTTNGVLEHALWVQESAHQNDWPRPKDEKVIYVNGEEYPVLRVNVYSGNSYAYFLAQYSLDHLVGEEVTVSLCPPEDGPFLGRYGDTVDDATGTAEYSWNEGVLFDGTEELNLRASKLIDIKSLDNININAFDGDMNIRATDGDIIFRTENIDLNDVITIAPGNANLNPAIDVSTKGSNHLVTKGYVDDDQQRQDDEFALDQKRQDDEIEALQIDQQRQDDEFALDQDRQDAALQDEIDARAERDALHDAQLETIEYKLDALLGLTFRGTYEFKHEADCDTAYQSCVADCYANDPQDQGCRDMCAQTLKTCESDKVRPGYFEAVDPDDQFDHLEQIVISKSDKSNVEIEWANVLKKDDYLEVDHVLAGQLDKTNYGLYRILEDPEEGTNAYGEEVYTMQLQFLQGDGVMLEGENYEIRGITSAEGVNPEELGDFLTKTEAYDSFALKSHVHKGEDITSGKININRLPTGTTSTTVAVGNHSHSGYSGTGHGHSNDYVHSRDKQNLKIWKSGSVWYIQ